MFSVAKRNTVIQGQYILYLVESHVCWATVFPVVESKMFNWPWPIIYLLGHQHRYFERNTDFPGKL